MLKDFGGISITLWAWRHWDHMTHSISHLFTDVQIHKKSFELYDTNYSEYCGPHYWAYFHTKKIGNIIVGAHNLPTHGV